MKKKIIQIIVDINLKREVIFFIVIYSTEKAEQHKTRIEITKKLGDII